MLWSLFKFILFLAVVAAVALGATWLLETDGGVQVAVANTEFTLGPLESVIGLVLLLVALWIVLKLVGLLVAIVRFLKGDQTAISRYFDRSRERRGYDAVNEGLLALAAGEGRLALQKAEKADRLLNRPQMTNLLTAQAAEMAGDRRRAEDTYKRMIEDDRTRFVGIRGIMKQRLADGDTDTAMKLAERAFAIRPKHEETQDVLLRLQAEKGEWAAARETLGAKLKHGHLPRDVHRRRDAVLALGAARDIADVDASQDARDRAIEANKLSPDLVPAAVMAADGLIAKGDKRQAARVLKKAWDSQPHPDLAAAFARIEPGESPEARIKRFGQLTKSNPDHPETRMLNAELLIASEDFTGARRALGDLAETDPTARTLTIMAAIERGTGADDAVVKGWLARALTAPRGPQWVCASCHTVHAHWMPVCDNCHAFDSLSWTRPPKESVAMPAGAEMLPLIVGRLGDSRRVEPEAATTTVDAEAATATPAASGAATAASASSSGPAAGPEVMSAEPATPPPGAAGRAPVEDAEPVIDADATGPGDATVDGDRADGKKDGA